MDGSSYEEIFLLIQVACVSSRKQILPKLFFLSIPSDQSIGWLLSCLRVSSYNVVPYRDVGGELFFLAFLEVTFHDPDQI